MNKKFLKSVATLFAVAVLGVSCSSNTNPEKETTTVTEREITDTPLKLALIAGLSGTDAAGIPLSSAKKAPVTSGTLELAVDTTDKTKLIATVKVDNSIISDALVAETTQVKTHLVNSIKANGTLTKNLSEIGISVTANDELAVTKDSPAQKSAQSGDITVALKEGYKLKLDSQGSLKELTDLKKLVVIVKLEGGSAGWKS